LTLNGGMQLFGMTRDIKRNVKVVSLGRNI
jgi:hypothetical protein